MVREYKMYIDGEWVGALDREAYDDFNPYTGGIFARAASGKRADAHRAIEAAGAAFPVWSHALPSERQILFLKAADILESKKEEIITTLAEETGCAFEFAEFQASFTPGLLREAAAQAYQTSGEIIPSDLPDPFYMAIRRPIGVVAGIGLWNAPLILSICAVCMPIACGNTAVLKPSTESAVAGGILIAEVFHRAGFPGGVLNVITNSPRTSGEIGDEFIENPKVQRINFIGSPATGRQLAEKAGRRLKRIGLELGGQNPLIILKDADIDYAVNEAAFSAFLHQGQICMSVRRIIVEKKISAEFTEKFVKKVAKFKVGNPKDPETVIGPLINQHQLEKVRESVETAIRDGAQILCGGKSEGLCYYPTILIHLKTGALFYRAETFGPVVSIIEAEDEYNAMDAANQIPSAISASVITKDFNKGLAFAESVQSGVVHIKNQSVFGGPQSHFCEIEDSGWGRYSGRAALEEFTNLRWISIQRSARRRPLENKP